MHTIRNSAEFAWEISLRMFCNAYGIFDRFEYISATYRYVTIGTLSIPCNGC